MTFKQTYLFHGWLLNRYNHFGNYRSNAKEKLASHILDLTIRCRRSLFLRARVYPSADDTVSSRPLRQSAVFKIGHLPFNKLISTKEPEIKAL